MAPMRRSKVDWAELKQRLARAEQALTPGSRERRAAMEARARALASPPPRVEAAGPTLELVEFELAQRCFAVETRFVREVQALRELTALPCTPPFVSGIINAHGRVIAVIDLKTFLELGESGLSDLNKVVILQHGDVELGILADRIVGSTPLPLAQLQPAPADLAPALARRLRGVTQRHTLVLDVPTLLEDPALIIDDEVTP